MQKADKKDQIPAISKWTTEINYMTPNWSNVFKSIFLTISDCKIRWFQYSTIYRNSSSLKRVKITDNDLCDFCKLHQETIQQFLWECSHVQNMWQELERWIISKINFCFTIAKETILFGVDLRKGNYPINFIILCSKYYIFLCKKSKSNPEINGLQRYIKYRYSLEIFNSKKNMNYGKLLSKWGIYANLFR